MTKNNMIFLKMFLVGMGFTLTVNGLMLAGLSGNAALVLTSGFWLMLFGVSIEV